MPKKISSSKSHLQCTTTGPAPLIDSCWSLILCRKFSTQPGSAGTPGKKTRGNVWDNFTNGDSQNSLYPSIPGADHILAQPLKRCSASRIKPNETVKNLFVLQFCSWRGSFGHGEMKIWLCLYSQHVTRYIWNWFCGRKQTKNGKIRRGAFFSRRVLWLERVYFKYSE